MNELSRRWCARIALTPAAAFAVMSWSSPADAALGTDLIFQPLGSAPGPVAVALAAPVSAFTFLTQIHVHL